MNRNAEARLEGELKKAPVALFDIDNTLVDGFSIFFFSDYLLAVGLFDSEAREAMKEDFERFRAGRIDYRQFAIVVVDHYSLGLRGNREDSVLEEGRNFSRQYQSLLFPYAESLVSTMKANGYTMAISGAPKEAFEPLAQKLGIDESHLLEAEVQDGIYTGRTKINMALDEEKIKVVNGLGNQYDYKNSFAFGDSIHDLPLLEAVGNPFIVGGGDLNLRNIAEQRGWSLVNAGNILDSVRIKLQSIK